MKALTLLLLVALASCSSSKEKKPSPVESITNESFKKARPLSAREVNDFYTANINALSPALQDETLDRHTTQELSQVQATGDPLLAMAIKCNRGEYQDAFAIADKAFDRYQKVAAFWNQVANCHLGQGNSRKALLFYNKALEVSPEYVPALNNIGVLYTRQGQDQKALVAFERANKKSRFAKTPRYNLGKTYLKYGLAEEALPILQSLLSDSPQDVDLLNSVASAYFLMSNYQAAAQTYARIPPAQLVRPEIGINYALTLNKLGNKDQASRVFNGVHSPETAELRDYYAAVKGQL